MKDKYIDEKLAEIVFMIKSELEVIHNVDTAPFSMGKGYCLGLNDAYQSVLEKIIEIEQNEI